MHRVEEHRQADAGRHQRAEQPGLALGHLERQRRAVLDEVEQPRLGRVERPGVGLHRRVQVAGQAEPEERQRACMSTDAEPTRCASPRPDPAAPRAPPGRCRTTSPTPLLIPSDERHGPGRDRRREAEASTARGGASRSPSARPSTPPTSESITASVANCPRMRRRLAPSALRMPISRVRSVTLTSMMFRMPMPPTTSDSRQTPKLAAVMTLLERLLNVWVMDSLVSSSKLFGASAFTLRRIRSSAVDLVLRPLELGRDLPPATLSRRRPVPPVEVRERSAAAG